MAFDIIFPLVLFLFLTAVVSLSPRLSSRISGLFEEREFGVREVLIMAVVFATNIVILAVVPNVFFLAISLTAISILLYLTTFLLISRPYIALVPPVVFLLCYFFWWNQLALDATALFLALGMSLLFGQLFSWKSAAAFVFAFTLVDVAHVFGTKMMISVAEKAVGLGLPLVVWLPLFPTRGWIGLGLGDFLVASVLCVQTAVRFGRRAGIICSLSIAASSAVMSLLLLNSTISGLPATVFLLVGWLATLIYYRYRRVRPSGPHNSPEAAEGP